MSEHRIPLRRAWRLLRPRAGPPDATPIDLPSALLPGPGDGPFRLVRAFHAPRLDPDRESLSLRIDDLPGLVAARLDDAPLPWTPDEPGPVEIPLDGLVAPGARATLALEVEPGPEAPAAPAGRVALVIRPRPPADPAIGQPPRDG